MGEAELRRVEFAAEYFLSDRSEPGEHCKLLIELRAHSLPFLLIIIEWAHGENGHRPLAEGFAVSREETARVLVQAEDVNCRPQHDRALAFKATDFPRGPEIDLQPTFSQRRRDSLRNFLR
jgi:hypothetical protein